MKTLITAGHFALSLEVVLACCWDRGFNSKARGPLARQGHMAARSELGDRGRLLFPLPAFGLVRASSDQELRVRMRLVLNKCLCRRREMSRPKRML